MEHALQRLQVLARQAPFCTVTCDLKCDGCSSCEKLQDILVNYVWETTNEKKKRVKQYLNDKADYAKA